MFISKLNKTCNDFLIPTVVYNLTNLIRNKMFNFNYFISIINVDAILQNLESLMCNCKGTQHIAKDHGHIITGDSCLLSNNKLLKLF